MVNLSAIYIIAEGGLEHRGKLELAEQLVFQAKLAGANCIKFQLFYPAEIGSEIWKVIGSYAFTRTEMQVLKDLCEEEHIDFLCSAFGMQSLQDIKRIGCSAVKIPSVCNENKEVLQWAISNFQTVYISTGLLEQDKLVSLRGVGAKLLTVKLLMCTSAYPCPYDQVQLSGLSWYDGLSDHTIGWEVPVAAAALGAKVIEKHLTLDKMNGGPDSKIALDPREFSDMVQRIRNVEKAMGDGKKKIEEGEQGLIWRKSV